MAEIWQLHRSTVTVCAGSKRLCWGDGKITAYCDQQWFPPVFLHLFILAEIGVKLMRVMHLIKHLIWNVLIKIVCLAIRQLTCLCMPAYTRFYKVIIEDSNLLGVRQQNECFHISKYCVIAEKGQVMIYIQFFSPSPENIYSYKIEYMQILNWCSLIIV